MKYRNTIQEDVPELKNNNETPVQCVIPPTLWALGLTRLLSLNLSDE